MCAVLFILPSRVLPEQFLQPLRHDLGTLGVLRQDARQSLEHCKEARVTARVAKIVLSKTNTWQTSLGPQRELGFTKRADVAHDRAASVCVRGVGDRTHCQLVTHVPSLGDSLLCTASWRMLDTMAFATFTSAFSTGCSSTSTAEESTWANRVRAHHSKCSKHSTVPRRALQRETTHPTSCPNTGCKA